MGTKTYPIEVDEDLWKKYKKTVDHGQNLDGPIIEFIERRVREYSDD